MSTVMWRTPLASSSTMPLCGTHADCWPSTCCAAGEGREGASGGGDGSGGREQQGVAGQAQGFAMTCVSDGWRAEGLGGAVRAARLAERTQWKRTIVYRPQQIACKSLSRLAAPLLTARRWTTGALKKRLAAAGRGQKASHKAIATSKCETRPSLSSAEPAAHAADAAVGQRAPALVYAHLPCCTQFLFSLTHSEPNR